MMKKVFAFCAVLALALVASPAVMAQAEANQCPAEIKGAELFLNHNVEMNGMRAFIDSETGELRQPTAQEAAALRGLVFQRFQLSPQIVEHQLANGGAYAQLDPSLHDSLTVHVGEDGTVHLNCSHNHGAPSEAPAREEM